MSIQMWKLKVIDALAVLTYATDFMETYDRYVIDINASINYI